ncbi:GIY-YIG nuclease family protein [Candidatus Woesebacteria bacterium]|nr:GIY-YIG nuclease family protein [Candidatus Woesebacteria bacterium]
MKWYHGGLHRAFRERLDPKPEFLMYYVYILANEDKTKHYIGYTKNLKRRLKEHKNGKSLWSKRLTNPILYYYEAYPNKQLAFERERKLKQRGSSKTGLLKRIRLK